MKKIILILFFFTNISAFSQVNILLDELSSDEANYIVVPFENVSKYQSEEKYINFKSNFFDSVDLNNISYNNKDFKIYFEEEVFNTGSIKNIYVNTKSLKFMLSPTKNKLYHGTIISCDLIVNKCKAFKVKFYLINYSFIFTPKKVRNKKVFIFDRNEIYGRNFRPFFDTNSHFTHIRIYNETEKKEVLDKEFLNNHIFFIRLDKSFNYTVDYNNNESKNTFELKFK